MAGGLVSGFGAGRLKSRSELKALRLRIEAGERKSAELRQQVEQDREAGAAELDPQEGAGEGR